MKEVREILIILDGWGFGQTHSADAIAQANTPYFDGLLQKYPHATLVTYGEEVGLPEGQMGNSEVGHLNIGAGRIVYQELARINKEIRDKTLHTHPVLLNAIAYAKQNDRPLHLIGLYSDGGVHSHLTHCKALVEIAESRGLEKIFIHAFTDGRDCDPKSGLGFLEDLQQFLKGKKSVLASVVGRYYAMDRDKRWERVKLAYDLLVRGKGEASRDVVATIRQRYTEGQTDEFILPVVAVDEQDRPVATIQDGDVVLCFNFRTDRPRQITTVLTQQDFPEYDMHKLSLKYVTMTNYDDTYKGVDVIFEKDNLNNTLGEVLAKAGKTQVRIAETEKYPHVTFFFSGGREEPFDRERRLLIPSPKVATYDLKPEMGAMEITETIVEDIRANQPDFICLNYANTDMVGHTGVFQAAQVAAETVDTCLGKLIEVALEYGYEALVIADHGNSDYLINEDGTPNTAHTKNPVPVIFVSPQAANFHMKPGKLADVAPTILSRFGISAPAEMSGEILLEEK